MTRWSLKLRFFLKIYDKFFFDISPRSTFQILCPCLSIFLSSNKQYIEIWFLDINSKDPLNLGGQLSLNLFILCLGCDWKIDDVAYFRDVKWDFLGILVERLLCSRIGFYCTLIGPRQILHFGDDEESVNVVPSEFFLDVYNPWLAW